MSGRSLPQWVRLVVAWVQARPEAVSTCAGIGLGLSTIVFSATNTISAQQAIAMAVPAIVAIIVGLVRMVVLDSWTAWRRGFEQGCQTALIYRLCGSNGDEPDGPNHNGAVDTGRMATRLASPRWPPGATN
jgi:hypothetical protein